MLASSSGLHQPVLFEEMLHYLAPEEGKIYVDGTFGAGGYTKGILQKALCHVYAVDRDPHVKDLAVNLEKEFPGRLTLLQGCFSDVEGLLKEKNIEKIDGMVLDIGVSSMQIDDGARGFSFKQDGPLDMRMSGEGMSAADIVNSAKEEELANMIYHYGGEKKSRRVARAIVQARAEQAITTTKQLADIVRSVVRMSGNTIDPATRTFQALRIWVNDELGELMRVLEAAERLLNPGGRIVVITFHSLEDSIVKQFFRERSGYNAGVSRYLPVLEGEHEKDVQFSILTKKAVEPTEKEMTTNIRSRSAKLRAAKKC